MSGEHYGSLEVEIATLKEKVRAIEEAENSYVRRFIGKIEENNMQIRSIQNEQTEIKHIIDEHIKWSGQIPINYDRLHSKFEKLETTVREGFEDLSKKFIGQDRDFNYFVRIPAKTVLIGILGVIGLTFGHTIIRFGHLLWDWVFRSTEMRIPK